MGHRATAGRSAIGESGERIRHPLPTSRPSVSTLMQPQIGAMPQPARAATRRASPVTAEVTTIVRDSHAKSCEPSSTPSITEATASSGM